MSAPPKFRDTLESWNRPATPPGPPKRENGISPAETILIGGIALIAVFIFIMVLVRMHPSGSASADATPAASDATAGPDAAATSAPEAAATATPIPATPTPPAPVATLAPDALVQMAMPDVALIQTTTAEGTSFLIKQVGPEDIFLTNEHVVTTNKVVAVVTSDKVRHTGRVLGSDSDLDLALVAVEDVRGLTPLSLGNSAVLKTGEPLFVVGYALGLQGDPTVTRGIISGRRAINGISYVQTDAAVNHGNSGGPVLDAYGQVVGVASYGYNGAVAQGINFAIPSDVVSDYVTGLMSPPASSGAAKEGTWTRMAPLPDAWQHQDSSAVWTGSQLIIWGGKDGNAALQAGLAYSPTTGAWTTLPTGGAPAARSGQTAVWTGKEMIIWGGVGDNKDGDLYFNNGARYNPATGAWSPIAPSPLSAREGASAVWTGSEMIVWGGDAVINDKPVEYNDGARYNPTTNAWIKLPTFGVLTPRSGEAFIWTGQDLLIWGGVSGSGKSPTYWANGARYSPATNLWTPMAAAGRPSGRAGAAVVWTGKTMIVWGGLSGKTVLQDGSSYDPTTDTWTPIATTGAPGARAFAAAVWLAPPGAKTGELIVWGGLGIGDADFGASSIADGARYDPATGAWTPLADSPLDSRMLPSAFWDGKELLIWGGLHINRGADLGTTSFAPDGAVYRLS